jgi:hypothetical protein
MATQITLIITSTIRYSFSYLLYYLIAIIYLIFLLSLFQNLSLGPARRRIGRADPGLRLRPFGAHRRVFYPANRPYPPLYRRISRRTRPILPPYSPLAAEKRQIYGCGVTFRTHLTCGRDWP